MANMQFAPVYPILYRILKQTFPNCLWSGNKNLPKIALTFDDGVHPQYTPQLLQVLERYQVTASFFWLGICVERSPELAREVYNQGHWLGLHGWEHKSFPRLKAEELKTSLSKTQAAIYQACGLPPEKVRDVRPPNGVFTPRTLKLLRQWDYRPVMWSVVPEDWVCPGVEIVRKRVLQQVNNGSLIVLHDGYHGGKYVAEIANILIPELLGLGYEFVTVNDF